MAVVSRFAGLFNAIDFAYGCGDGFPPCLRVDLGTQAAGAAGTLTVGAGFTQLSDGTIVFPLNANAPITIGIGAGADTVTPTSTTGAPNSTQDAVSLVLTATHAHGAGDRIASGTFGLQEALNFASAAGGGQVIVSGKWNTLAGGTAAASAIIAAATIPTGVTVWDNRTGASFMVQSARVVIPNANVLTLYSAGYPLIAAPGSGYFVDVIDATLTGNYVNAAFTAGGVIQLNYGTGVSLPASATIAASFLTGISANNMCKLLGVGFTTATKATYDNIAVRIACATQDFVNVATGATTVTVNVNYRILQL